MNLDSLSERPLHPFHRWLILTLAIAAIVVVALRARRPPSSAAINPPEITEAFITFRAPVMSTTFVLKLPNVPGAQAAAHEVFALFRHVNGEMSEWNPNSPVSKINREAGKAAVRVPEDLRALIHRGIDIGNKTNGAFDITWAALWPLWNFRAAHPKIPDPAKVARQVALVDYRKVEVNDAAGTVELPVKGMKIGLGGIAKGWALDQAADILAKHRIHNYLIVGGGQVLAEGLKDGQPWKIGIRDPRGSEGDYFATIPVSDASLSTSGDYERFFIVNGIRYHHILDPRTGMPSRGLRSATVVSSSATLADALSTAIMVMGKEKGLALAESLPNVQALVVDSSGGVFMTDGLQDKVTLLHPPVEPDN